MHAIAKVAMIGVLTTGLAGCYTSDRGIKQTLGTIVGAAGGAAVGSTIGQGGGKVVAVGIGTLIGAAIGNELGRSLDRADQAALVNTTNQSLEYDPDYTSRSWSNPNSGNYGEVQPTRTYRTSQGYDCREFEQTIFVEGRRQTAVGTACRNGDGTWSIVG